jgi:hypothetical protein
MIYDQLTVHVWKKFSRTSGIRILRNKRLNWPLAGPFFKTVISHVISIWCDRAQDWWEPLIIVSGQLRHLLFLFLKKVCLLLFPVLWIRFGVQFLIQIHIFDDLNLQFLQLEKIKLQNKKKFNVFIPCPPRRTFKLQKKPSALKKTSSTSKHKISWLFLWVIFPLDPIPHPLFGSGSSRPKSMRIRFRILNTYYINAILKDEHKTDMYQCQLQYLPHPVRYQARTYCSGGGGGGAKNTSIITTNLRRRDYMKLWRIFRRKSMQRITVSCAGNAT